MLPDFYLLVKNSWLRIGDIVSLSDLLASSEKANFLECMVCHPTARRFLDEVQSAQMYPASSWRLFSGP